MASPATPALTSEGHAALMEHDAHFAVGGASVNGVAVCATVDRLGSPCVVTLLGLREDGTFLAERRTVPFPPEEATPRVQDYVDRALSVGRVQPLVLSDALDWFGLRGGMPAFADHYADTFRVRHGGHPEAEALCPAAAASHLAAAGARDLSGRADAEVLHALSCIGSFDHNAYDFYAAPGDRRDVRLQAARAYPLLAAKMAAQPLIKFAIDTRKSLREPVERAFGADEAGTPFMTKALLDRFQGLRQPDHGIPADVLVQALSRIPPAWFPAADEEWDAFCDLTQHGFRHFAPKVGERPDKLCPGVGGKWAEARARIAKAAASTFAPEDLTEEERKAWRPVGDESLAGLRGAFLAATDMLTSFRDLVVLPVAASATAADVPLGEVSLDKAGRAAARILFGGKSLVAIMESQRHWHTQLHNILGATEAEEELDLPQTEVAADGWAPLCDEWEAPNGISVVPLTDPRAIQDEGAGGLSGPGPDRDGIMGLGHCVGGYTTKCKSGESHIVSFRRYHADGSFTRLSTAEFEAPDPRSDVLSCRQHHGVANGPAPRDAKEAYDWFVSEVAANRIPLNRDGMLSYRSGRTRPQDDVTLYAGYDRKDLDIVARSLKAWERYLPKPLRGLSVESFRGVPEMAEVCEEVCPTYRYAAAI